MAIIYVDGIAGNDSNDGLTRPTAKATLAGSRAAYTAGNDIVLVRPTIYLEGNISFTASNDDNVLVRNDPFYSGMPIFDFEFRADYLTGTFATNAYFAVSRAMKWFNIHFRDMRSDAAPMKLESSDGWVIHCVFEYRGGGTSGAGVGTWNASNGNPFNVYNCTFLNITTPTNGEGTSAITRNCYAPQSTTMNPDPTGPPVVENCAYIGGTGDDYDTTVVDPGLRDINSLDFRLDPTTVPADYNTFMTGGYNGGRIGAFGRSGFYYNNQIPQFRFLSPDPLSGNPNLAWENEGPNGTNTYTDGTPGDIIEDAATDELKIDLVTTPLATGGRVRSGVFDLGTAGNPVFTSAVFSAFEDGPSGALIDTNTTLPQKFEYRTSATSFAAGDVSPAWVEMDATDVIGSTDRYIQFRVTFRTDHTNA